MLSNHFRRPLSLSFRASLVQCVKRVSDGPRARVSASFGAAFGASLLACTLAGCGTSSVNSNAATDTTPQQSAAQVQPSAEVVHQLAPSGTLRAAINYGNPTLATRDAATGELHGTSVDLARELARELGVPVTFVPYTAARKVVEGARDNAWDVAFVGIDPQRAQDMEYTAPYVIIEGVYMVRTQAPFHDNADVDRDGVRIAVSNGSAYDLFLSRQLHHATLVRVPDPTIVTATMLQQSLDVVAGVKQRSQADAQRYGDLRLLPGNFMVINQAMATQKGRPDGIRFLRAFIERMKASGFVAQALHNNHIDGASVGPLSSE
jgi:polar amino acid transport system substrate-binding protein